MTSYDRYSVFPTRSRLWQGAILHTIAHAIWIMQHPLLADEVVWRGFNYEIDNSEGTRGIITFSDAGIVGVFRDNLSPRAPWSSKPDSYDFTDFLKGIPTDLYNLMKQHALPYMHTFGPIIDSPVITAAFWGNGEALTASEPWSQVLENGANILDIELLDFDEALAVVEENYDFLPFQLATVKTLFKRKMAEPDSVITLSEQETNSLTEVSSEGFEESSELFLAIGIKPQPSAPGRNE